MFDMFEELSAIHRTVALDSGTGTVSVSLTRTYAADADDVWEALTRHKRLARWFSPVSGTFEVGGYFHVEGNASGEIRRCDRPSLLEFTFGSPQSIVAVRLTETNPEAAPATTLTLTHRVPLSVAGSGAGALFVGPGWDGTLLALGRFLRGEHVGNPIKAANSPEVIDFNRGSLIHWTQTVETSGSATPEQIAGAREAAITQYTTLPS
jgi:uncharacterized protein YndB with AHSA1/START domain